MLEERILPRGTVVRLTGCAITLLADTVVAADSHDWQELERINALPSKPITGGKLRVLGAKE